jgi:hypothetical protein
MQVGAPFLYIGPAQSHVMDIVVEMNGAGRAYVSEHGNVDQVVRQILDANSKYSDDLQRMARPAESGNGLLKMIEIVEAAQCVRSEDQLGHAATPRAQASVTS